MSNQSRFSRGQSISPAAFRGSVNVVHLFPREHPEHVHIRHAEMQRHRLHQPVFRPALFILGAAPRRHIAIAAGVDHQLRTNLLQPGFAGERSTKQRGHAAQWRQQGRCAITIARRLPAAYERGRSSVLPGRSSDGACPGVRCPCRRPGQHSWSAISAKTPR